MEKKKIHYCSYKGCRSTSEEFSLFKMPSYEIIAEKWREFIKNNNQKEASKASRLCELHFDDKYIKINERNKKLIPGACPIYTNDAPKKIEVKNDEGVKEEETPRIMKRKASVKKEDKLNFEPCRICLKASGSYRLDSKISNSPVTISRAIKTVFNFELILLPPLPQTICNSCLKVVLTSYALKRNMIKSDRILREECGEPSFQAKRPKLAIDSNPPDLELGLPQQNSANENVTFFITEIPDNAELLNESEMQKEIKVEPLEHNNEGLEEAIKGDSKSCLEVNSENRAEIKTEKEVVIKPYTTNMTFNVCKKCKFKAKSHLSLLFHIDSSTTNCIELYNPKNECFICHQKFMLMGSRNKHIQKMHAREINKIKANSH